ncbi:Methenyltetrahydrofolate cyclohydrolase [Psidium guajava]|nr:Methenyltetrahydrofolate cyclohydrolase [Psidium guajava]
MDNLNVSINLPSAEAPYPQSLLAELLWAIWKARNSWVFQNRAPRPCTIVDEAISSCESYHRWNKEDLSRSEKLNPLPDRFCLPQRGYLKLSVDASWCSESGEAAVAGILQNSFGLMESGFVRKLHARSAGAAEAFAVRDGLKFLEKVRCIGIAADLGKSTKEDLLVQMESDCLPTVRWVLGQEDSPWDVHEIIIDSKFLLNRMKWVSLAHCPRKANQAADWVAKAHRSNSLNPNWLLKPPLHLCTLLNLDCGNSYVNVAVHE